MLSNEQKIATILANGWEKYTNTTYVKTEWVDGTESNRLNCESHLAPHWYVHLNLDEEIKLSGVTDIGLKPAIGKNKAKRLRKKFKQK